MRKGERGREGGKWRSGTQKDLKVGRGEKGSEGDVRDQGQRETTRLYTCLIKLVECEQLDK